MKPDSKANSSVLFFMKCLLFSYVLTVGLLLLLALFLYRFGLQEKTVSIAIILIYIAANFLGGFIAGKKMGSRKFLWGLLTGCLYFAVLLGVSLLVDKEAAGISGNLVTSFLLCAGSGMLGGMVG